jgi:phosphoesterase RecJ-like protein
MAKTVAGMPTAVIDHHAAGVPFGDVRFIDTRAPSTSYLIQRIIEQEDRLQKEEAELNLFAIATDTGFFRHLDAGSTETFSAVARLTEAGASPKQVYDRIYGGYTLQARRLLGLLLHRAEPYFNGLLLISCEYRSDTEEFGVENRDSDTLYKLLFASRRCEAIVLIREEADCRSVSLRSIGDIDVSVIAKKHGGGGHVHAAGFESSQSVEELKSVIKKSFPSVLHRHNCK